MTAWGPRSDSDATMYAIAARARTAFYTPGPLTTPKLLRDELNHITARVGVCIDEHQRADGRGHVDAYALLVELLIIDCGYSRCRQGPFPDLVGVDLGGQERVGAALGQRDHPGLGKRRPREWSVWSSSNPGVTKALSSRLATRCTSTTPTLAAALHRR